MKRLNKCKSKLLITLSFLLTSGCTLSPPDVAVFENLQQYLANDPVSGHLILKPSPTCMKEIGEAECGHGIFTVSKKQVFVGERPENYFNKKPWSVLRQQSVLVPAEESYAPMAAFIINSCKKNHCDKEVEKFKIKLGILE